MYLWVKWAAPLVLGALAIVSRADAAPRYVAMGSSYSAGPGVGAPDPTSGNCGRSKSNYAQLLAKRRQLSLTDVACSGATTENILEHGQYGFARQIDALDAETRLVTILIGGNDLSYVQSLFSLSCRDRGASDCRLVDAQGIKQRSAALSSRLGKVIDAVRRRSPKARIILVGYLPAVPVDPKINCQALFLSKKNADWLRRLTQSLSDDLERTAARKKVEWVSAYDLGKGHEVCSAEPYVSGFGAPQQPGWAAPVPYHPTQAGMNRIAEALDQLLAEAPPK